MEVTTMAQIDKLCADAIRVLSAEAVQKAIQKLMDDGTYKKILDTWGVSSGAVDKAEINPSVE